MRNDYPYLGSLKESEIDKLIFKVLNDFIVQELYMYECNDAYCKSLIQESLIRLFINEKENQ